MNDRVPPILVVLCGNPIAGEDGWAPALAAQLEQFTGDDVEVVNLGARPADLLDHLDGRRSILLIDALRCGHVPTGWVLELDATDGRLEQQLNHRDHFSCHGWSILSALSLARQLGKLPPRVRLIGSTIQDARPGAPVPSSLSSTHRIVLARVALEAARLNELHS